MTRTRHKLNEARIRSGRLEKGRHADGGSLYLNVSKAGTKSWVFLWSRSGKRREMGLGAYPTVSLADARRKAEECRKAVEKGQDPIAEKRKQAEPTFAECAEMFLDSMSGQWRNAKHRYQWEQTLGDSYCREIRDKKVSEIDTDDILAVLSPIWTEKHETASRLRGRIERVLDYARVRAWRARENPALWRGHLRGVLPTISKRKRVVHLAAMPYQDVPAFMAELTQREAMSARALAFQILTAARPGEVRGATWDEIDLEQALWTIPGTRMKAGQEHRVPLTEPALELLNDLHALRAGDLVFPGQRNGRPLSDVATGNLLRRMGAGAYTAHGFRSSFRDWCGDCTSFPREIAEAALAHQIGNEVERSYRRADALEKRRSLMRLWADYLSSEPIDKVVHLRQSAGR